MKRTRLAFLCKTFQPFWNMLTTLGESSCEAYLLGIGPILHGLQYRDRYVDKKKTIIWVRVTLLRRVSSSFRFLNYSICNSFLCVYHCYYFGGWKLKTKTMLLVRADNFHKAKIKAKTQALRSLHIITSNKRGKDVEINQNQIKTKTKTHAILDTIQRKWKTLIACVKVGWSVAIILIAMQIFMRFLFVFVSSLWWCYCCYFQRVDLQFNSCANNKKKKKQNRNKWYDHSAAILHTPSAFRVFVCVTNGNKVK